MPTRIDTQDILDLTIQTEDISDYAITPIKANLTSSWDFSSGSLLYKYPILPNEVAIKSYVDQSTSDNNAAYVVLALTSSLSSERLLTSGTGINIVDEGSNANVIISINSGSVPLFIKQATQEVPSGTINGSNTIFRLLTYPISGTIKVFKRGLRMKEGDDYILSSSLPNIQYVVFQPASIPTPGSNLFIDYFRI